MIGELTAAVALCISNGWPYPVYGLYDILLSSEVGKRRTRSLAPVEILWCVESRRFARYSLWLSTQVYPSIELRFETFIPTSTCQ